MSLMRRGKITFVCLCCRLRIHNYCWLNMLQRASAPCVNSLSCTLYIKFRLVLKNAFYVLKHLTKYYFAVHVQVVRNIIINFTLYLVKLIQVLHFDFVLFFIFRDIYFLVRHNFALSADGVRRMYKKNVVWLPKR